MKLEKNEAKSNTAFIRFFDFLWSEKNWTQLFVIWESEDEFVSKIELLIVISSGICTCSMWTMGTSEQYMKSEGCQRYIVLVFSLLSLNEWLPVKIRLIARTGQNLAKFTGKYLLQNPFYSNY